MGRVPPRAQVAQAKLYLRGARADSLLVFLSEWGRIHLAHHAATQEVTDGGDVEGLQGSYSQNLRTLLRTIISDAAHHARLNVDTGMDNTLLGGFPIPDDLTGPDTSQRIDWSHIERIIAVSPQLAVPVVAHEIAESYEANYYQPVMGTSPFIRAHEHGLTLEGDISQELGGGRRFGASELDLGSGKKLDCFDYESYYLVLAHADQALQQGLRYDLREAARLNAVEIKNTEIDMEQGGRNDRIPPDVIDEIRDCPQSTIVVTRRELKEEIVHKTGINPTRIYQRTAMPERVIVRMPDLDGLRGLAARLRA